MAIEYWQQSVGSSRVAAELSPASVPPLVSHSGCPHWLARATASRQAEEQAAHLSSSSFLSLAAAAAARAAAAAPRASASSSSLIRWAMNCGAAAAGGGAGRVGEAGTPSTTRAGW